jgi:hypothetical protein
MAQDEDLGVLGALGAGGQASRPKTGSIDSGGFVPFLPGLAGVRACEIGSHTAKAMGLRSLPRASPRTRSGARSSPWPPTSWLGPRCSPCARPDRDRPPPAAAARWTLVQSGISRRLLNRRAVRSFKRLPLVTDFSLVTDFVDLHRGVPPTSGRSGA